jgi:hypothetical protein
MLQDALVVIVVTVANVMASMVVHGMRTVFVVLRLDCVYVVQLQDVVINVTIVIKSLVC